MGRYAGALRTHEEDIALSASLELMDGRVKINIGDTPIGDWALQEVEFEKTDSGYRIAAEGDHVLLDLEPKDAVALGLHLSDLKSKKTRRTKDKSTTRPRRGSKASEESSGKPTRGLRRRSKATEEPSSDNEAPPEPTPRTEPQPTPAAPERTEETPPPTNDDAIASILSRMASGEPGPATPPPSSPTRAEPAADMASPANDEPEKPKKAEKARRPKREKKAKAPRTRSKPGATLKTKTPVYLDRILDWAEPKLKPYLPGWVFNRLSVLVVLLALVLIPIFPGFMATILLVLGGLTVLFGSIVYTDSVLSSRFLYGRTTPNHVLVVGVSTVVVGIILTLIAT